MRERAGYKIRHENEIVFGIIRGDIPVLVFRLLGLRQQGDRFRTGE